MADDIRQYARRLFDELWNQGRLEFIDDEIDPGYQGYIPLVGKLDREGLKQAVRTFRNAYPDMRFSLRDVVAEGDKAVVHWTCVATNTQPFMGRPPSGKKATVNGFTLLERRNGKTIRDATEYDLLAFFEGLGMELGLQPPRPGKAAATQPEVRH